MGSHFIQTEVEIDASAERAWSVLSDFNSYPEWNPFIKSAIGQPIQGERLRIAIQPSGTKPMRFSPKVTVSEPGRELRWLGRLVAPGVFDGEHRFIIEKLSGNNVRLNRVRRSVAFSLGRCVRLWSAILSVDSKK